MSRRNPDRWDEPARVESSETNEVQLVERTRLVPPIVSVAMIVGLFLGVIGFGFGYRLGQQSITPAPSLVAIAATPTPEATAFPLDLQTAMVSDRLQTAYLASAQGSWAICDLGLAVTCHVVIPSVDRGLASHQAPDLAGDGIAELGRPWFGPGRHLILAASLGPGITSGSLVALEATGGQRWTDTLSPIDPGNVGVDYFDLGAQPDGTYVIPISFVPNAGTAAPPIGIGSYLPRSSWPADRGSVGTLSAAPEVRGDAGMLGRPAARWGTGRPNS